MKTMFILFALLIASPTTNLQSQDYFGQYASKGALESLRVGVIQPGHGDTPGYYCSIGRVESFPGIGFYRATRTSFSGGLDIDLSDHFSFANLATHKPDHKIHLQLGLTYGSRWHIKTSHYEGNVPKSDDLDVELGVTVGITPNTDLAISHDRSTDLTFIGLAFR